MAIPIPTVLTPAEIYLELAHRDKNAAKEMAKLGCTLAPEKTQSAVQQQVAQPETTAAKIAEVPRDVSVVKPASDSPKARH